MNQAVQVGATESLQNARAGNQQGTFLHGVLSAGTHHRSGHEGLVQVDGHGICSSRVHGHMGGPE